MDIGNNPITVLSSMEFAPLSNLTVLKINNLSNLMNITKDSFRGLKLLTELEFSKSNLKTIPVSFCIYNNYRMKKLRLKPKMKTRTKKGVVRFGSFLDG